MIGRDLDHCFIRAERQEGAELLRVEGLTSGPVRDISFNVHRGEVVGLYGLVGSGRTEIAETLFGIRPLESGTIHWDGVARTIRSPRDAIALGIGLVPEDRKHQGLVLGLGGSDNLALPNLGRVSRLGVIASGLEGLLFEDYRKRLSISTAGPKQPVLTPSGGNQQKMLSSAAGSAAHPRPARRRADARRRCRRQGGDPRAHSQARRKRPRRHRHLLRNAGDPRRLAPHPDHRRRQAHRRNRRERFQRRPVDRRRYRPCLGRRNPKAAGGLIPPPHFLQGDCQCAIF
jgi:energy-coupling factor transporter ATP-binding protein EcfA2